MTMRRLPDIAIRECVGELRAACRLPIDEPALDTLVERLRHNFERILTHPDGPKRWANFGQRMRDNARHLGALANFFGNNDGFVGPDALNKAFEAVHDDCTVRAESEPLAYSFCTSPPPPAPEASVRRDESTTARVREPELV